jgi:hypothetical protein
MAASISTMELPLDFLRARIRPPHIEAAFAAAFSVALRQNIKTITSLPAA